MSTQVSWIEPEQLRALVGQLQGSAGDTDRSAWEVHTLPGQMGLGARDLGIPDDDLWLPNEISPALEPEEDVNAFLQTEPAIFQTPEPASTFANEIEVLHSDAEEFEAEYETIQPEGRFSFDPQKEEAPIELNRIRQKLQAIREKAIEAGLLAHLPVSNEVVLTATTAAPTPVPPEPNSSVQLSGPDPVGDTGPLEQDGAPESAPASPRIISPFGLVASPQNEVGSPTAGGASFVVPEGSIMQRLNALAEWASVQLQTRELIIADDHGDVLWGEHAQSGLLVSTMMASKAALRSTALGACDPQSLIEQPISPGRTLIVVPCETQFGTLSLALIRGSSLSISDTRLLRSNMNLAVDGGFRMDYPQGEVV